METEGLLAPASTEAVREQYEAVGPAAQATAKAVATALEVGVEDYRERVDEDVVLTAREAIFASLLTVHVGERPEFDQWLDEHDGDPEVTVLGSEQVPNVAWHDAPVAGQVLAATFANEPAAATHTLRRQAFARIYREVV